MKKFSLICCILTTVSCSSFVSTDILVGDIPVDDKSVSDEILCLTAFTSEVKIPKSKIQQNIMNEITKRNITPEQCSSYVVSNAGGIQSFCAELNSGYVSGKVAKMPSFGNYITLQDMISVEKTLGIDCNTKQYVDNYNRVQEEERTKRLEREQIESTYHEENDFSKSWRMFQPKMNMINCTSFGSSSMCNDSRGNSLYINKW